MSLLDDIRRVSGNDASGSGGTLLPGVHVGDQVRHGHGTELLVRDPATGEPFASISTAAAADVDAAVDLATAAARSWSRTPGTQRGAVLSRLARLVEARSEPLALMESKNVGKTVREAAADVATTVTVLDFYGRLADQPQGRLIHSDRERQAYVRLEPFGPCAIITPWNFPLLIAAWKTAPALAAGNTVVLKPSELSPLSTLILADLAVEAGLPSGVLNVITGDGPFVGRQLVGHPDIARVSFTGSAATGREVMALGARSGPKPVSLELGGKSASIVFADADLRPAANGCLSAAFGFAGQKCAARSRLLVDQRIYDDFLKLLLDGSAGMKVGDPRDTETHIGPLITENALMRVSDSVDAAVKDGAVIRAGGLRLPRPGYFYEPTILTDVSDESAVFREEVFGPLLVVRPFVDEEEAVAIANNTDYGLAATVWTSDLRRAHRVAAGLEAGTVSVNTPAVVAVEAPFGGFKRSGIGRDLGVEGLLDYLQSKHVNIDLTESDLGE